MKTLPALLAAGLALAPALAGAQTPPGPDGGPPPWMQQAMQARNQIRDAVYAKLSPDHRARVQAIVAQVNGGSLTDPRAAATQIDAVLSAPEKQLVLDHARALHERMRAERERAGEAGGAAPNGPGPGGPGPNGPGAGPGADGERRMNRTPDAGRALLMLSVDPQRMRELRRAAGGDGRP